MGIGLVVTLLILRGTFPDFLAGYRSWNALPAHIATYLFLATIIPGALQRLSLVHPLIRLLIAWRRTLGIAMYFFALVHLLFLLEDMPWFSGGAITSLDIFTATGLLTMLFLLPVLVTSNTSSITFLKKRWKILQRLTYITVPLIAIHLFESGLTIPASLYALTAVLIIISFITPAIKKNKSLPSVAITSFATLFIAVGIAAGVWFKYGDFATEETIVTSADTAPTLDKTDTPPPTPDEPTTTTQDEEEKFDEEEGATASEDLVDVASDTDFTDGVYEANGEFVTARGRYTESVDLTLTITDDIVTDMQVVGNINNRKSQQYQDRFEAVIDDFIIGKNLSSIDVDAVSGASDTTDGFMVAVNAIRTEARQ